MTGKLGSACGLCPEGSVLRALSSPAPLAQVNSVPRDRPLTFAQLLLGFASTSNSPPTPFTVPEAQGRGFWNRVGSQLWTDLPSSWGLLGLLLRWPVSGDPGAPVYGLLWGEDPRLVDGRPWGQGGMVPAPPCQAFPQGPGWRGTTGTLAGPEAGGLCGEQPPLLAAHTLWQFFALSFHLLLIH